MLMSDPEDLSPDVGNQEQYEISLDKSTERLVAECPIVEEDPFNLRRMTKLKQPDLHKYMNKRGGRPPALDKISENSSFQATDMQLQAGSPAHESYDAQRYSLDLEILQSNPGNSKIQQAIAEFKNHD
jgi:hypothetical protein